MGRKEQERRNIKRAAMNYDYENTEAKFSHDTHLHVLLRNLWMFLLNSIQESWSKTLGVSSQCVTLICID